MNQLLASHPHLAAPVPVGVGDAPGGAGVAVATYWAMFWPSVVGAAAGYFVGREFKHPWLGTAAGAGVGLVFKRPV